MSKQTKNIIIAVAALVAVIAAVLIVWKVVLPATSQGSKTITVEIVHKDKTTKTVKIKTDAEWLRGALEEKSLVAGTESEYGLYVLTVDGETADEAAQEWWCFTKGGEMLNTGVDTTPISDGDKFEITLTVGW